MLTGRAPQATPADAVPRAAAIKMTRKDKQDALLKLSQDGWLQPSPPAYSGHLCIGVGARAAGSMRARAPPLPSACHARRAAASQRRAWCARLLLQVRTFLELGDLLHSFDLPDDTRAAFESMT